MGEQTNRKQVLLKRVRLAVVVFLMGVLTMISSYVYHHHQVLTENAVRLKRLRSAEKEAKRYSKDLVKRSDYRSVYTWNLLSLSQLTYTGATEKGVTPAQLVETFGLANQIEIDANDLHLYWKRSLDDEDQDLNFKFVREGEDYYLETVTLTKPLQEYRGDQEDLEWSRIAEKEFKNFKKGDPKTGEGGTSLDEILLRYPKPSEIDFKTQRQGNLDGSSKRYKSDRLAAYVTYKVGGNYQDLLFLRQEDGHFAFVDANAD